jgi:hypothetical protein
MRSRRSHLEKRLPGSSGPTSVGKILGDSLRPPVFAAMPPPSGPSCCTVWEGSRKPHHGGCLRMFRLPGLHGHALDAVRAPGLTHSTRESPPELPSQPSPGHLPLAPEETDFSASASTCRWQSLVAEHTMRTPASRTSFLHYRRCFSDAASRRVSNLDPNRSSPNPRPRC